MDSPISGYDLPQLASRAGVSIRTVRYYIQQGLLPSPEARGPGAHYTEEHLERLQLIKRLQREHLPLAEIRRILENWSSEGKKWGAAPGPLSAKDYIHSVLGRSEPPRENDFVEMSRTQASFAIPSSVLEAPADYERFVVAEAPPPKPAKPPDRSQWERVTLATDIELHIRRPLSRELNKKLGALLEAAREILKEDQ